MSSSIDVLTHYDHWSYACLGLEPSLPCALWEENQWLVFADGYPESVVATVGIDCPGCMDDPLDAWCETCGFHSGYLWFNTIFVIVS